MSPKTASSKNDEQRSRTRRADSPVKKLETSMYGGCPLSVAAAHHAAPSAGRGFGSNLAILGAQTPGASDVRSVHRPRDRGPTGYWWRPPKGPFDCRVSKFATVHCPRRRICRSCFGGRDGCTNGRIQHHVHRRDTWMDQNKEFVRGSQRENSVVREVQERARCEGAGRRRVSFQLHDEQSKQHEHGGAYLDDSCRHPDSVPAFACWH